ncbi:MAG: ABC transporter permease [Roseibacillus sp.]|jgi:ribose transport system permease protein|nr:ABC transporter permease [Roseibacillus sp.]
MTLKIKFGDYGMILVLLVLIILFSLLTIKEASPSDQRSSQAVAERILNEVPSDLTVVVYGKDKTEFEDFAKNLVDHLGTKGRGKIVLAIGGPGELRRKLNEVRDEGMSLGAIATAGPAGMQVIRGVPENYPEFQGFAVLIPESRGKSTFFTLDNFKNVTQRVVVIAIVAIGMTMVIITAGIDLSVGSLVGLAAMTGAWFIKERVMASGGDPQDTTNLTVLSGFLFAILCAGAFGLFSGALVACCKVAPFIVTLGVMMIARGIAEQANGGFTVSDTQLPAAFRELNHGALIGIPNTMALLILLYVVAHIFMTRTKYGRYIYAVGGNMEAARLSGVPVTGVIILVYTLCGLLAGLGGCMEASRVNAATTVMGTGLELEVIAAVVVGGTSLFGGSGRIFGTLIGAFIIAIMRTGMNQLNFKDPVQDMVLGAIIIIAVLLDRARQAGFWDRVLRRRGVASTA